jgi:hypothetical protein
VRRKFDLLLGAALCCAVLTSCGGSSTPTPSPTPTGTGTPTPTPSATPIVFDFAHDVATATGGLYIYANFTPTGGSEVFSDASRINGTSTYSFAQSPEKAIFGFQDLTASAEFLGTERTSTTTTQRIYSRTGTSLTLDVPYGNVLRATYLRTDPFTSGTTAGTLRSYRVGLFTVPVTITSAISTSTSFTGTPHVVGGTLGSTPAGAASAIAQGFTITPGTTAPTVAGSIRVSETVANVSSEKAVLAFTGAFTSATSNLFSGTIADTANGFSGTFSGTMAGPNREEVLLLFSVTHTDGRKYVGSFIGH